MKQNRGLANFYWKTYIVSVSFIFITIVATSLIFRAIIKDSYYGSLERELKTEALLLSQVFSETQKPDIIRWWKLEGKSRITIININGDVQLDTHYNPFKMKNQLTMPEVSQAVRDRWGKSIRWSEYIGLKMFFVAGYFEYDDKPPMIIRLGIPIYVIDRTINKTTSTVVLGGVIIFIIVSLFSFFMIREVTYPIMKIADSIRSFSNGNLSIRIPNFRSNDLNLVSYELNRMIDSITKGKEELSLIKDQTIKILSSMHEGIILVDRKSIIKEINKSAKEIFGYQSRNLVGKNLFSLIVSRELKEGVESIINGRNTVSGVVSIKVPDERRIEFTCTPFGSRTGVVIVLYDITKISKLENIRKEFVANVSHELKTPITSVKGFVETLTTMDSFDDPLAKKFLYIIQKNILRMENIIEDLLVLSKIESGAIDLPEEIISINDCINNAITVIRQKYNARNIISSGMEYGFMVRGNPRLLELAIINLIDNAVKYSNDDVNVLLDGDYRRVIVSITDRGIGIPPSDLEKIFESFYRVDKARSREMGGTGLGLTIVKKIVEAHKGLVKVYSTIDRGSIFKIELPRFIEY